MKETKRLQIATARLSKNPRKIWAFSSFCDIMFLSDENVAKEQTTKEQIEMICTEDCVPQEHLLRKIDAAMDFNKIYDFVEKLYCADNGRRSIDPVVLFKMVLIQHLYVLPSLRRTADEVSVNMAYRWFLGYGLNETMPHFSTVRSSIIRWAHTRN